MMNRLWQWMNGSLRRKWNFLMLVASLLPLLSLGVFTYVSSAQMTREKTVQTGTQTLRQQVVALAFMIDDVKQLSVSLIGQEDVQGYLNSVADDDGMRSRVQSVLASLSAAKPHVSNVTIYPAAPFSYLSTVTIYDSGLADESNVRRIVDGKWTGLYEIHDYAGFHQVFTFLRPIRSIYDYRKTVGWLAISLDEAAVSRTWPDLAAGSEGWLTVLLDGDGRVLAATDKSWLGQPLEARYPDVMAQVAAGRQGTLVSGTDGDRRLLLFERVPDSDWVMAALLPHDAYWRSSRYILLLTAGMVAAALAIHAVLVLFVVRRVTKPLALLTRLLSKVNPDGPMPEFRQGSRDEIGRLGESYNKLGRHIEQLKDRLIRTEARKKEADLRALQAQIHPHFLYNTLSSVQWMAFMRGEQEIGEMVGALGHFLQFSLNKGREFCPVEQEVAHVRHYVRIQQYRYPDRFHLEVEEDPSLAGSLMLKLLLQPLVENAMMHGILKREGEGTIRVKLARSGKNMLVSVEDDGIGMSEARLSEVRAALRESGKGPGTSGETGGPGRGPGDGAEPVGSGRGLGGGAEQGGSGYGLGNVHERLLLHYGPGAELRLDSRPGGRTVVSFTIPVMEGHDETNDRR